MAELTKEGSSSQDSGAPSDGLTNWSALTSLDFAGTQLAIIVGLAIAVILGTELLVRVLDIPTYVFPKPSEIATALVNNFPTLRPHIATTLRDLLIGYVIGATLGIFLAAVITQFPFAEKVVTPYILILVTTPMMALVPLLILQFGFGETPRIIAVTLAVGPMVMINAATGFRRTDAGKLALARLYGASTYQIFAKVRFPLALPMIIVGLMVGGIFGLLTAVGAEMVGGGSGLGNRLMYYSSLARMDSFFSVLVIVATMGISLYVLFYFIGKRWASWEA
ncbi:MAG: ABC transporter permease [Caldilineales bacterium]|nr:ABC transporter permease [Caldilineales bacterium]